MTLTKKQNDEILKLQNQLKDAIGASNYAFGVNDFTSAEKLIEKGANVNYPYPPDGKTLLHIFTENSINTQKRIEFLLQNGANINARNAKGETALHLAVASGNFEVVKTLAGNSANIEIRNNENKTAYDCVFNQANPHPKIVQFFKDKGAYHNYPQDKFFINEMIRNPEYAIKALYRPKIDNFPQDALTTQKNIMHARRGAGFALVLYPVIDISSAAIKKMMTSHHINHLKKVLPSIPEKLRDEIYEKLPERFNQVILENRYNAVELSKFIKTIKMFDKKFKESLDQESFKGLLSGNFDFKQLESLYDIKRIVSPSEILTPKQILSEHDKLMQMSIRYNNKINTTNNYEQQAKISEKLDLVNKKLKYLEPALKIVQGLLKLEKPTIKVVDKLPVRKTVNNSKESPEI